MIISKKFSLALFALLVIVRCLIASSTGEAENIKTLDEANALYCSASKAERDGSYELAFRLYSKLDKNDFWYGTVALADCYRKGLGVPRDYAEAFKFYRRAAEADNYDAQCKLGICYERGEGVKKNPTEAYAYYNLSSTGYQEARKNRDALEKKMTKEQIIEGQSRTKKLKDELESSFNQKYSKHPN